MLTGLKGQNTIQRGLLLTFRAFHEFVSPFIFKTKLGPYYTYKFVFYLYADDFICITSILCVN